MIPPLRGARLSQNNKNIRKYKKILQERDDAINYINNNTVNADKLLARAAWKKKVGYHMRSLIESTMLQIKQHCRDRITNRNEQNRIVQSQIKCKIVNLITTA